MKVKIGSTTYTKISNLSFAPETDVIGVAVPINEFVVDIHTDDDIKNGANAELRDDLNQLWAKYWIVSAERLTLDIVRVRAQSKIALLDRVTLPAVMYSGASLASVLSAIFASLPSGDYYGVQTSLDNAVTITGFCPEQTARDRLIWVCLVAGAYVKSYFAEAISVWSIDDTEVSVPLEKTFWKPSVTYRDYVTAVKCKYYTFTQGTPTTTDKWVTDGTNTYIVTETEVSLINTAVPQTAPENVVTIEDVTLINQSNVDNILSHLAKYYFKRMEVDLDIINNYDYIPGQRLLVYADEDTLVSGYADKCSFAFGLQARSKIHLMASETKPSGNLVITYTYNQWKLKRIRYSFPVGYTYQITNPYIDLVLERHRYVFRPINQYATGTIASGTNTNTQTCAVALDLDLDTGILHIISVDEVTTATADSITTGTIA